MRVIYLLFLLNFFVISSGSSQSISGSTTVCKNQIYTYTVNRNGCPGITSWQVSGGTKIDEPSVGKVRVRWTSDGAKKLTVLLGFHTPPCQSTVSRNIYFVTVPNVAIKDDLVDSYCSDQTVTLKTNVSSTSYTRIWEYRTGSGSWNNFHTTNSRTYTFKRDEVLSSVPIEIPIQFRVKLQACSNGYQTQTSAVRTVDFFKSLPLPQTISPQNVTTSCGSNGSVTFSNFKYSNGTSYQREAIIITLVKDGVRGTSRTFSGSNSYVFNGLEAGNYHLAIEYASPAGRGSCVEIYSNPFVIGEGPDMTINSIQNIQPISCNSSSQGNDSDAQIEVVVNNGKPPFKYFISKNEGSFELGSGGSTNSRRFVFNGLGVGEYKIRVVDNCVPKVTLEQSTPIEIGEPAPLNISASGSDISCANSTDGQIIITGTGGTGSKTYSVNGGSSFSSNNVFADLADGTYNTRIKDSKGCEQAGPALTINAPSAVVINSVDLVEYDGYGVSCTGESDGQVILVDAAGGTGSILFSIDGGSYTSYSGFSGLSAGDHEIRVKDVNNCVEQTTITLTAPPALLINGSVTSDYGSGRALSCSGASDGEITLNASGGRGTYEYSVNNGANWQYDPVFNNLPSGTYIIKVRDKLVPTCIQTAASNIVINDPPSIDLSETISSYNGYEISCNGSSDGNIILTVSGGSGSFTYSWSNGSTTKDLTGVEAGTYTVTITDTNGCSINESYTLNEPATLLGSAIASNFNGYEISCYEASDGVIDLDVSGGTAPYTYLWNNGATTEDLNGLGPGSYDVTITDVNNCSTQVNNINITQPEALEIAISNTTHVDCNGASTGEVVLSSIGGVASKQYSIDGTNYQTSDIFSNLSQGSYTLYVSDGNGCTDQTNIVITEPPVLTGSVVREADATCGDFNGEAELSIAGGTTPYSYRWENSAGDIVGTETVLTGVGGGVYTATITDANGCVITRTANVSSEDGAIVSTSSTTATTCFDSADGQATISITGVSPFDIAWSSGETGETANQLAAGDNAVTVTDANGCVVVEVITIDSPEAISYTITNTQQPTCHDSADGNLTIQAQGGAGSYTYSWDTGTTDPNLTNISQGIYEVTITDANGCSFTDELTLEGIDPISIATTEIIEPTCVGDADGSVIVEATGGNDNYTYQWSNGETGTQITNVPADEYQITVTDEKGCSTTETIVIAEPEAFEIDLGGTIEICEGAAYEVSYPLPNASYNWSSGNGFSSTDEIVILDEAGTYTLEIINEDGCVASDSFELLVSSDLLNADFLMVNEAYVGDTVIVIDISWPIPEDVAWAFGEGVTIVEQNSDLAVLTFTEPGRYEVFIDVSLADCQDFYSQSINVLPASERPSNTGRVSSKEKLITSFRVYPNPSDGQFDIEADLSEESDINIKMIDLSGNSIVIDRTIPNTKELRVPFNQALKKGLYLIMIEANGESKTRRIMIK